MDVIPAIKDFANSVDPVKVLVVDDLPENHRALKKILDCVDAEIFNATNGQEALSLTLRHQFAVVLLDVMMPVMDGFETASLMRINEDTKNVPIIFITAADKNEEFEFKGYELGAVDYLFKPIQPNTLASKVKVFIELEQQRQRIKSSLDDIKRLENRNSLLLNSIGEGVIGLDVEGNITFTNPAALDLIGATEPTLLGRHILDTLHLAEATTENLPQKWQLTPFYLACSNGENFHEPLGIFQNQEKELFPVEYNATPIHDNGKFIGIVIAFQDITERKKIEEQLARLAQYDCLTGLINRYSFGKALQQFVSRASRSQNELALLFIDLDQFKLVNDNLGHDTGDFLLQEVAQRISACIRQGDVLGRFGGDEFTLILETYNDKMSQNAAIVAGNIISSLAKPFHIRGNEITIGASIGIAVYTKNGASAESLMRCADIAMYRAKECGRNNYQFFTEEMQLQSKSAMALASKLREAVEKERFMLYYQPKIHSPSRRICGVEALLRWQDELGRFISPEVFVPKLEEMGLIDVVGKWVIEGACRQAQEWHVADNEAKFTIAINLSMRQLLDPNIPQIIASALEKYQLSGEQIEVEITESMMMQNPRASIERLRAIHDLGVAIAIDDFGTGYSSLSYLQNLPIDALKIDKSFVHALNHNTNTEKIIRAIVALAHNLGLEVIAEGVETQGQLDFLDSIGCDIIQGYYFSPAVAADKIEIPKCQHPNTRY
jgi:diguanylate cyclase (GGDEF)-like protein/PAS domain S-box-containing protein